jgi:plastocyanin
LTVADGPRIGDHWHAAYQFFACGEKQPNARFWESGVNTHGDGIIHMEPIYSFEERSGASLVRWFEYGGGLLTDSEIRIPGSSKTFRNDDPCPNGKPGELQVFVTSAGESAEQRLEGDALQQYIPHDGDRIMIRFRTEDEPVVYSDRTVIPPEEATRTVEIAVTDDGTELGARFDPARIEVAAGETVRIVVGNQGGLSHVIRVAGEDGQYGTNDDFVSVPDIMLPGEEGYVVVRLTHVGEVPFGDDTLTVVVEGVIAVLDSSEGPAAVTPRLTPPVGAGTPQVR